MTKNLSYLYVNPYASLMIKINLLWWIEFYKAQNLSFVESELKKQEYLKPVFYSPYPASQCDKIPNRLKP